jgi:hypothetical protein
MEKISIDYLNLLLWIFTGIFTTLIIITAFLVRKKNNPYAVFSLLSAIFTFLFAIAIIYLEIESGILLQAKVLISLALYKGTQIAFLIMGLAAFNLIWHFALKAGRQSLKAV